MSLKSDTNNCYGVILQGSALKISNVLFEQKFYGVDTRRIFNRFKSISHRIYKHEILLWSCENGIF